MSDEELLAEARKFEKNLLNFFWRQGVQYSEGEDLVQETYLRLWKYRREYKPTAKLSTFLFLMARQVRIDALRRQTRREGREKSWGKEAATTAAPSVGSADAREDVRWAISQLSEPHREVVELGVFQRMSNALKKLKEVFDERRS